MLRLTRFALLSLLSFTLACGTTAEKQDQRFKRNLDTIEALMAKNPMLRPALAAKVEAFKAERAQISGDEEAQKNALLALNRRVEEYTKQIAPAAPASAAKPASAAASGATSAPASAAKPASAAPSAAAPASAMGTLAAPVRPLGGSPGFATPSAAVPLGSKLGAPPAVVPASGIAPPAQLQPAPTGKLGGPAAPASAPASGKLGGY